VDYHLRRFDLPPEIPGALFAASMPGALSGDFDHDRRVILAEEIDRVICLAEMEEVAELSPGYARGLIDGGLPWQSQLIGMPDGGAPPDRENFLALARELADRLRRGDKLLIHCRAGIGRTGMLATLILMALGESHEMAMLTVRRGGSGAETPIQYALELWAAKQLRQDT
jgi:protein-tyrosine phosphatase